MIWNFAIRRPVLTGVIFVALAIFGVNAYKSLPVRAQPDVDYPVVMVSVVLPGADPSVVEREVVELLEEQINTIEGIKTLSSTARAGFATIVVRFELWRDSNVAVQDVRDRVERAKRDLPIEILEPVVQKMDPGAQAIMWIALTGDERWDPVRITQYIEDVIKPRLETVRGVGQIQIGGARKFAVRVKLDPARLAAHHLTVQDVVDTIRQNNVDIPTGRIESQQREFLVKTDGRFSSAEPINALVVAHENGSVVRIGDVGEAVEGVENDRQLARFTTIPTVAVGVIKQSNANTVSLAQEVRSRIEQLSTRFPPGLSYAMANDSSVFIKKSVDDLTLTIVMSTGLVILVVLVFLGSWRGTLVTTLAIPTSLLTALAAIYLFGFSLNSLTMLALILAIGIVVDDAIVVLESSYRHMEAGAEPLPATRIGTTEVAFAAIANTLSLAAVFLPVALMQGMIGRFFFEFGVTVTVTVFASTFTALTLTPVLCSRIVGVTKKRGTFFTTTERIFAAAERRYERVLEVAFAHRRWTLAIGAVAFATGLLFAALVSHEFAPSIDRDGLMISFETPEGSTLTATDRYAKQIEGMLSQVPEVDHWFLAVGLARGGGPGAVNTGMTMVHLTPRSARDRPVKDIMHDMRGRLSRLVGGRAFVLDPAGSGPPGAPIEYVLQHHDLDALALHSEKIVKWMRAEPEFVDVNSDLRMTNPQVQISIRRDKASEMGVTVSEISTALRYLLGEPDISRIERSSRTYDVIPEISTRGEMTPDSIGDVYVRGPGGRLVALANLVEWNETVGPSSINHFDRMRSVKLSASSSPGVADGDAMDKLEDHVRRVIPADFDLSVSGRSEAFREAFLALGLALLFAVVFVYLVLAAQFESLVHPFTILLTLPLSTIGAFGGLWLFGMPLSLYAYIGLIMLMGLVTKNAILLVDFSNVLVARGLEPHAAAIKAGQVRFRPVLMTATSTMLGMLPLALGFGSGGEARAPLGICVAAGMFTSTALTLVVVPVFYSLVADFQAKVSSARLGRARRRVA